MQKETKCFKIKINALMEHAMHKIKNWGIANVH
jgi:hypothetical protein